MSSEKHITLEPHPGRIVQANIEPSFIEELDEVDLKPRNHITITISDVDWDDQKTVEMSEEAFRTITEGLLY
ncbi:hypothetical protein ACFQL7_20605 [Halocatena marina]|uniref:Uncharacterized protein n=1 Tax=Halocatena marina TaxID=2934937 RepID=A0ABD5YRL7_9EURY|nr:hypothetical protein [Halocatena marina]